MIHGPVVPPVFASVTSVQAGSLGLLLCTHSLAFFCGRSDALVLVWGLW